MSNMSYCRWQNTFIDLYDCIENLEEDCSSKELQYKKFLLQAMIKCVESGDAVRELSLVERNLQDLE